jgi:hypothetical protein
LKKHWNDNDWMSFSKKAEHTLASRPLGEMVVYSRNNFHLYLDDKFRGTPTLLKIVKMIALTHVAQPKIMILESKGTAFYQRTYNALDTVALSTGFWTLTQWLQLMQVEKVISAEARGSQLQLMDIRNLFAEIRELNSVEPVEQLNKYIKTHHPTSMNNGQLTAFFQGWLNQVMVAPTSPGFSAKNEAHKNEPKLAKIISFKPRTQLVEGKSCGHVLMSDIAN